MIFSVQINPQSLFWEQYCFNGEQVSQLAIDREENFYAIVGNTLDGKNLFISSDGGLTWQLIFSKILCGNNWHLPNVLIDTTNQGYDKIYLFMRSPASNCLDSLFYSTDEGTSWNVHILPSDLVPQFSKEFAYNSNGDLYLATHEKIYTTTDSGATWQLLVDGNQYGWDLTRIVIDLEDNLYTNDEGFNYGYWERIYKSEDNGSTWELDLTSYGTEDFTKFASLPSGELYAGLITMPYLFLKKSANSSWNMIENVINPGSMAINIFKYIYVSKVPSNIIPSKYSPDYGLNWFDFDDGLRKIYNLMLDSNGYLYSTTNTGIYRSVESTFPIVNSEVFEFPETAVNDTSSLSLNFFNPFNSQLIIDSISSTNNSFFLDLSFPITINTGDSILSTLNFSPEEFGIYNDTIFIYSNLRSHRLLAYGSSPSPKLLTNPPNLHYYLFGVVEINTTKEFSFKIINNSPNILQIDSMYTNKPQYSVNTFIYPLLLSSDSIEVTISFTPDSNLFYIDTVFIVNNSTPNPYLISLNGIGRLTSFVSNEEEVYTFNLNQNYPNPFNPSTIINYQIPELSFVTLKVYDVLGNEIATLVSEELPAGEYEVEFNPASGIRNLVSGIYFYQLKAGSFIQTKKMILMK